MNKALRIATLAAAGLVALSGAASACPDGYRRVVIQGNSICQLDASASNNLKASTGTVVKQAPAKVKSQ